MTPSTQTSTTSTAPSNPDVNPALSAILQGVKNTYNTNPSGYYFPESMYAGVGDTTKNAWQMGKGSAVNPAYSQGIGGAINSFSDVASGKFLNNMDPEYQAMIDRSANETAADVNASMGANGRYGSNVHTGALVDRIGGLRTGANVENRRYEQGRQASAASLLPQLLQAGQMPAELMGRWGAMEDADRQGELQGRADLYTRRVQAPSDQLAKLSSIMAGNAGMGGSNTTMSQPGPSFLQQLLGAGAIGSGIYKNIWGS